MVLQMADILILGFSNEILERIKGLLVFTDSFNGGFIHRKSVDHLLYYAYSYVKESVFFLSCKKNIFI